MIDQEYPTPQPASETIPPPSTEVAPIAKAAPAARADIAGWQAALALILIVLIGGYFRFTGVDWDEAQGLHPDERFMSGVVQSIRPVYDIFTYFDTEKSTLSPFPYGSYTYGMFPLFFTRYMGELLRLTEGNNLLYLGRVLSGLFDLAAAVMLFFLGARLYNRRVGLLAAGLYVAAVLPIQLSHYFTVDSFATIFIVSAFYVAIPVMEKGRWWHYLIFGLLTGLAMASKMNTAPLAGVIVLAGAVRLIKGWRAGEDHGQLFNEVIVGWLIAGSLAALSFRIFQPYAFTGPSIFGVSFNQRWLDIMREVTDQVAGKADFPPNTHWTNRPQLTYAWIQTAGWGMGLLLGIVATLGWLWAAWRAWHDASFDRGAKREWEGHLLLVVWVGAYFAWQNAQFWRYMRYFMPIYPFAILLGAWLMIDIFDRLKTRQTRTLRETRQMTLLRIASLLLIGIVALNTYGYAFAFTRIYTRTNSRVEASRWIFQNFPGPLNARIAVATTAGTEIKNQPLHVADQVLKPGEPPLQIAFEAFYSGTLSEFTAQFYPPDTVLQIKLTRDEAGSDILAQNQTVLPASAVTQQPPTWIFAPTPLTGGQTYFLHYTTNSSGAFLADGFSLRNGQETVLPLTGKIDAPQAGETSGLILFTPEADLTFDRLTLATVQVTYPSTPTTAKLILSRNPDGVDPLAEAEIDFSFADPTRLKTFSFSAPVNVEMGTQYHLSLQITGGEPARALGTILAFETGWDDMLPLRIDKYDPFGGIYQSTNIELYEPDNADKRQRILDALGRSDYLMITSNRAYDAMPRLPLRYPMTLKYFQALFNCPDRPIFECGYAAREGLQGQLGYKLIKVFESNPGIGSFEFSDQTAEEAFTVYDHPKVMIFQRQPDYSPGQVAEILNSVDLTQVIEQSPINYTAMPSALRLPPDRLTAQTNGGTWRDLFDPAGLLNANQSLGVVAWYLLIFLIGVIAWPIVFVVFPGLPDRGYPLAKFIGLVIITWVAWFGGSYQLFQVTPAILWGIVSLLVLLSGWVAFRNRRALLNFTLTQRNYILIVEGLTLALFLFFLWVRWLNPDLWHPWLGGEKPADFSFFQSAIRAVYFPPYDPWLSGHYVNYYYYGYVIGAIPTKLTGIVPAIAYNLVLSTMFAFAGIGAFCVAYNLVARQREETVGQDGILPTAPNAAPVGQDGILPTAPDAAAPVRQDGILPYKRYLPYLAGGAAMIMMVLLGNLFQVRQLWRYLPEVADPPTGYTENFFENAGNVLSGGWRVITGQAEIPGGKDRWYFAASRAILHDQPDMPITEFPYFSFLYADLHPHLFSMSLMLAALAWMISLAFAAKQVEAKPPPSGASAAFEPGQEPPGIETEPAGNNAAPKRRWPALESVWLWFIGGLLVGALQPTNTWDFPGFLVLGVFAIAAAAWLKEPRISRPMLLSLAARVALFGGLSIALYYPFRQWFATDFSSIELWAFTRTPLGDYFTVHGLFLFITLTLLAWESNSWLKARPNLIPTDYLLHTPLGELLPRIKYHLLAAATLLVVVIVSTIAAWTKDYVVVWFALPLIAWAVILFFQPGRSTPHRAWLVIFSAGVGVTIVVELINLRGDLGRSNSVFKYYIEAWIFFSVTAGAALAWLLPVIFREWSQQGRRIWLGGLTLLVASAASYTVLGTHGKATDRWPNIENPPHTLDGNAYMLGAVQTLDDPNAYQAVFDDEGHPFILAYDYGAIRWLQDNVSGTPVIAEGNTPLYRWGSRIAINTGLPNVVGWDYHVKQHDSIIPPTVVDNRITELQKFYNTLDAEEMWAFLNRYNVQYIVVGELERKYYAAEGLDKFKALAETGELTLVYPTASVPEPEKATYIYKVGGEVAAQ